jgi:hypothetical protein
MPLALIALLAPLIGAFARLITGAITAGIIYYFLTNVIKPYSDDLTNQIVNTVSNFSTVGGSAIQVISYLDFANCISLLLSASAACFAIKVASVAIRAFGITTG